MYLLLKIIYKDSPLEILHWDSKQTANNLEANASWFNHLGETTKFPFSKKQKNNFKSTSVAICITYAVHTELFK